MASLSDILFPKLQAIDQATRSPNDPANPAAPPKTSQTRETARAFADARQFPRDTYASFQARQHGFPPWERETLTFAERKAGSLFGKGFADNPLSESPGEKRVRIAKARNAVRMLVRQRMDEGSTDEQIAQELAAFQGASTITAFGGTFDLSDAFEVPADIRRRFGV